MSSQTWDERWMSTAVQKGSWSKDRSRKVGAVIVDADNVEVSNGWNGFPRKINDEIESRHQRPAKYLWSEHSERNALYNAARKGRATAGCRIYQSMYPCAHCARGIIQSGIVEVITVEPDWNDATYADEFAVTKEMLAEAGVSVRFIEGQTPVRVTDVTKPTNLMSLKTKKEIVFWMRVAGALSLALIIPAKLIGYDPSAIFMLGIMTLFMSFAFDSMA